MPKKAVLLLNLGSPDSPTVPDVRRYLREFLSDERVLDNPALVRWLVLNLFILPNRPKSSAEAYRKVWTDDGAPLIAISRRQRDLLEAELGVPVYLAMRYGNPSIPNVIERIVNDGVEDLYLAPLYPHYAMSSYETVVVRVREEIARLKPDLPNTLLQPFYNDPQYIDALVESAQPYLEQDYDRLLFSFHGIPERHLHKSDPSHAHCLRTPGCCASTHPAHATCYRHQCFETVRAFTRRAHVPDGKYLVSFQSRLGRDPWLQPYTDQTLERLGRDGVRKVLVITPAFVTDCLETLEEIAMGGSEIFQECGGKSLTPVPCLNDHPAFIRFMAGKIRPWAEG